MRRVDLQRANSIAFALTAILTATAPLVGCDGGDPPEEPRPSPGTPPITDTDTLAVYTVSYPLAYFAERIGGDSIDAHFPAPTGVDPADWSPEPATVARYQNADLILLNGAGYARWTQRATLPQAALFDTSAAFVKAYIERDSTLTHTHGPGGEHSHADLASTTWLDPRLAAQQAEAVEKALTARRPSQATTMGERMLALRRDLEAIDERLSALSARLRRAGILYSHPVYQYLDRRYALDGHAVHWEPGETPGAKEWAALERELQRQPATLMLWEGEPLAQTAQQLARLGVRSVVFPTLANPPPGSDYIEEMNGAVDRLAATIDAR